MLVLAVVLATQDVEGYDLRNCPRVGPLKGLVPAFAKVCQAERDRLAKLTPMQQVQEILRPFMICVRDNARLWGASTSESAEAVSEAAVTSCVQLEQHAKFDFVVVMTERVGISGYDAEGAWNDQLPEMHATAKKVALTAVLNVRSN